MNQEELNKFFKEISDGERYASFAAEEDKDLSGLDLSNRNLDGFDFEDCILRGCNFENSTFYKTECGGADFTGSNMKNANCQSARMEGAILVDADLTNANFKFANLEKSDLTNAHLDNTNIVNARLLDAKIPQELRDVVYTIRMHKLWLTSRHLDEVHGKRGVLANLNTKLIDLSGVDLRDAILKKEDLDKLEKTQPQNIDNNAIDMKDDGPSGVTQEELDEIMSEHNLWLETRHNYDPQGKQADLHNRYINGLDFSKYNLTGLHIEGAMFKSCNFNNSRIEESVFQDCSFKDCNFENSKITKSEFNQCLVDSNFENSYIKDSTFYSLSEIYAADLSRSNFKGVTFENVDMNNVNFRYGSLKDTTFIKPSFKHVNLDATELEGAVGIDFAANIMNRIAEHSIWVETKDSENPYGKCADLTHVDLDTIQLSHLNLRYANLEGQDLSDFDLTGSDLSYVNLQNGHFGSNNVWYTITTGIDLRGGTTEYIWNLEDPIIDNHDRMHRLQDVNFVEINGPVGIQFNHGSTEAKISNYGGDGIIPDNDREIMESYLESTLKISIEDDIKVIGDGAFRNCKSLKSIEMPNSIISIGKEAFVGCRSLETIYIPDSVMNIGEMAFNCPVLKEIEVSDDNPMYSSKDGVLFNKNKTELICCPQGKEETLYVIPNDVTSIEKYAFLNYYNLKNIKIPDSVTNIKEGAFHRCAKLESIEIPEGVQTIGDQTFRNCENLKSITLPEGLQKIGDKAFLWCNNLESIEIPEGVQTIGSEAFEGCESLTSINIPDSVKDIGESAFYNCKNLESVSLPGHFKGIDESVFENCKKLESNTMSRDDVDIDDIDEH